MGLSPFSSSSYDCPRCCNTITPRKVIFSNPDPRKFQIIQIKPVGQYTVVEVLYTGCTNYEGHKILVFDSLNEDQIRKITVLDPHFSEKAPDLSPVARFVPNKKGWLMAAAFALLMSSDLISS